VGSCSIFFTVVIVCLVAVGVAAWIGASLEKSKLEKMSPEEKKEYFETKKKRVIAAHAAARNAQYGQVNTQMVCPHCQTRGMVRTKRITQKKGISGSKATAAVLTAGVSILATGLARKEGMTEARCDKCSSVWHF
jgi:hypothetical protein